MATIGQAQATMLFLRQTYLHGRTASDSWAQVADLGAQAAEAASARQFERAAQLFILAADDEYELTGDVKATDALLRAFDGSWVQDGKAIQLGDVIVSRTPGDAYDEKSGTCVRCHRWDELGKQVTDTTG